MTVPFILPAGLGDQEIEAFMIRVRIDELLNKLKNKDYGKHIKSKYDSNGRVAIFIELIFDLLIFFRFGDSRSFSIASSFLWQDW